jgi:hypothetical protein
VGSIPITRSKPSQDQPTAAKTARCHPAPGEGEEKELLSAEALRGRSGVPLQRQSPGVVRDRESGHAGDVFTQGLLAVANAKSSGGVNCPQPSALPQDPRQANRDEKRQKPADIRGAK